MREVRNCDGLHPEAGRTLGFAWAPELQRCPWSAIPERAWRYVRLWGDWKAYGCLPEHGDLLDQPGHVYHALRACEAVRIEREADRARRLDMEQARATEAAKAGRRSRE